MQNYGQWKLMSIMCNRSSATVFKSPHKNCVLTSHQKNTLESTSQTDKQFLLANRRLVTTQCSPSTGALRKDRGGLSHYKWG